MPCLSALNGISGLGVLCGSKVSLIDRLVSFWTLANKNVGDSFGSNNLTAHGLLTNDTGPSSVIPAATAFAGAGSTYPSMTVANNGTIATAGSVLLSCWVNLASKSGNQIIAGKVGNLDSNATIEYLLYYSPASNRFRFLISDGSSNYLVDANTLGSPSTGTWYLLIGWYDAVAKMVKIVVNGQATPDSADVATGLQASTSPFVIAANNNDLYPLNGSVASVGLWTGMVPTTDFLAALRAGGNGVSWPLP